LAYSWKRTRLPMTGVVREEEKEMLEQIRQMIGG
jgi:hypothetical protein